MARETCKDCGLSYRYQADLEEHKRVGCRMQTSEGPTWSAKEVESESELISKDIAEAIAGLDPSEVMRLPEDEEAPRVSRFDRNPE
jgi:hypothetical protein